MYTGVDRSIPSIHLTHSSYTHISTQYMSILFIMESKNVIRHLISSLNFLSSILSFAICAFLSFPVSSCYYMLYLLPLRFSLLYIPILLPFYSLLLFRIPPLFNPIFSFQNICRLIFASSTMSSAYPSIKNFLLPTAKFPSQCSFHIYYV